MPQLENEILLDFYHDGICVVFNLCDVIGYHWDRVWEFLWIRRLLKVGHGVYSLVLAMGCYKSAFSSRGVWFACLVFDIDPHKTNEAHTESPTAPCCVCQEQGRPSGDKIVVDSRFQELDITIVLSNMRGGLLCGSMSSLGGGLGR